MPDDARDARNPITRRQFLAGGGDAATLRRDYQQVAKGLWVPKKLVDSESLIRAALAIHPADACASHATAAVLHDLPVPEPAFVHVTVVKPHQRRFRPRVKPHVRQAGVEATAIRGIRTSDVIGTFIECAGSIGLLDQIILGDAICKRLKLPAAELVKKCHDSAAYYAGAAERAAGAVRDGVDSPMETRSRMLMVWGGLPEPEVNYLIRDENGEIIRQHDLYIREARTIIEYDGRQHGEDLVRWRRDLVRREETEVDGDLVIVLTAPDIFVHPAQTLKRIRRVLLLRGYGELPPLKDDWRQHFAA